MNRFYVYVYLNPLKPGNYQYILDNTLLEFKFEPFYVGKGTKKRYLDHIKYTNDSNRHKANTIKLVLDTLNRYPDISFIKSEITEEEAYILEEKAVSSIGRRDINTGPLTNLNNGGKGGMSGYKMSEETRRLFSKVKKESAKFGKENHSSKKVYQYSLNGDFIKEWLCITDCTRELGFQASHITGCIKGKNKTAFGFQWLANFKGNNIKATTKGKAKKDGYLEIKDTRYIKKV